jgi:phosphohistidine swiveling domain-containing protein
VTSYITPLSKANREELQRFGGKASNLGELSRAGLPVPEGYVITTDVCRAFFDAANVDACSRGDIRNRIATTPIPHEIEADILAAHHTYFSPNDRVAVRSSATTEDLSDASFAGQHETYYFVDATTLLKFVRDCWASLYTDAAIAYRSFAKIKELPLMAVIVQRLIPSEVSGVAFTKDPMGDESVLVIESSWGMGAAIVDGRVTPDRYLVNRADLGVRQRTISDKRHLVPANPSEKRLQPVPLSVRQRPTLSEANLRRVASLALRCEVLFGGRQDVEWAMVDDQVYILQSRPITTSAVEAEASAPLEGRWVLFKPLAENFTEPVTPLTADVMADVCPPFARFVDGWMYINLDFLRPLIPYRLSESQLVDMALLRARPATLRLRWLYLPVWLLILLGYYLLTGVFYARTRRLPVDFMSSFRRRAEAVRANDEIDAAGAIKALVGSPRFFAAAGDMALQVNLISGRYFLFLPALRSLLSRWCPSLPAEAPDLLTGGIDHVLSTEMSKDVRSLAKLAREDEVVQGLFRGERLENLHETLRHTSGAAAFLERLDAFLAVHGHRAVKEFELSTPRWHEDPTPVLGMIRNMVTSETLPAIDPKRSVRDALWAELRANLKGVRFWMVRYLIERIRYYVRLRENSRFYHIMLIDVVRSKVLAHERELKAKGLANCDDDIFFLFQREIDALTAGELGWPEVEARIRRRRQAHTRRARARPRMLFGVTDSSDAPPADASRMSGFGASPGVAEGRARVIMDPTSQSEIEPGEILVAPYTDPAWTPLFLCAGAAVVEVGSYLSHAGTLAREYGMPCVVDVSDCTRLIRTGDRLRVDASRGEVWILE